MPGSPQPVLVVCRRASPDVPGVLEVVRALHPGAALHVVLLAEVAQTPREPLAPWLEEVSWGVASVEVAFDLAAVASSASRTGASLVVMGPWPEAARARVIAGLELGFRWALDVMFLGSSAHPEGPPRRVGALLDLPVDPRTVARVARGLARWTSCEALLGLVRRASDDVLEEATTIVRAVVPLPSTVRQAEAATFGEAGPLSLLARAEGLDLVLVPPSEADWPRMLATGLLEASTLEGVSVPLVVLHREVRDDVTLTVSDVPRARAPAPVRVEVVTRLGRTPPLASEVVRVVGLEGELVARAGVVPVATAALSPAAEAFALEAQEGTAVGRVLPARPLVLVDERFPLEALGDVEPLAREAEVVVARLRPAQALLTLRRRFDEAVPWGARVGLLDASSWLDDGDAADVPEALDGLRLVRLARRLLLAGVDVRAVVTADEATPCEAPVPLWSPTRLARRSPLIPLLASEARVVSEDPHERWAFITGSISRGGNALSLELENAGARRALLAAIGEAKERVHWQTYMVDDDLVSAEVVDALVAAAGRGVQVRVLVDALYGGHEAYGLRNPALVRLEGVVGVEVRGVRPVAGLPSLADLKQRNHRKRFVVDGVRASVSGRNMGATYYRGFDEVELGPQTPYREVPWLDAGLWLEGPLVEDVEQGFAEDWTEAGGPPFEVRPVPPVGQARARLVSHGGLRDARTLETVREMLESARRGVVLVNTFPLVLELQRAAIRAVERGVAVRFVLGHVRPRFGVRGPETPFAGPSYRALADELVRSRLEPVLRAGGVAYVYGRKSNELGMVFPHVHAKLYVRDDDLLAVGSANLDVTSAFWESEALVLVEDGRFVKDTLVAVDQVLAQSLKVAPEDWAEGSSRREWLSRAWPSLVG